MIRKGLSVPVDRTDHYGCPLFYQHTQPMNGVATATAATAAISTTTADAHLGRPRVQSSCPPAPTCIRQALRACSYGYCCAAAPYTQAPLDAAVHSSGLPHLSSSRSSALTSWARSLLPAAIVSMAHSCPRRNPAGPPPPGLQQDSSDARIRPSAWPASPPPASLPGSRSDPHTVCSAFKGAMAPGASWRPRQAQSACCSRRKKGSTDKGGGKGDGGRRNTGMRSTRTPTPMPDDVLGPAAPGQVQVPEPEPAAVPGPSPT